MHVRLVLGPAGSGKTFRCVQEIRQELAASPEGPPLLLVAPRQTTYQMEARVLAAMLAEAPHAGFTRLHVLSFERLARFIFVRLNQPPPALLDEEGRLMVLRGLLARQRDRLKLFRASARLTGFARQLSLALRELQRCQLTPESLNLLAERAQAVQGLSYKLQDLATLLREYLAWLTQHQLLDADCLLTAATEALNGGCEFRVSSFESEGQSLLVVPRMRDQSAADSFTQNGGALTRGRNRAEDSGAPVLRSALDERGWTLWVDGFAELTGQELDLLAALQPYCRKATITFCLDRVPREKVSSLSTWAAARRTFEECKKRISRQPNLEVSVQLLERDPTLSRFAGNPVLAHLERSWAEPQDESPRFRASSFESGYSSSESKVLNPESTLLGQPPSSKALWRTGKLYGGGQVPKLAHARRGRKKGRAEWERLASAGQLELGGLWGTGAEQSGASSRGVSSEHRHDASLGERRSDETPLQFSADATNYLRLASCADPEAEAALAAREILRHVRAGGRYRETAVLVRTLELYHQPLQRVLTRYEIPFFLDRREPMAHHPLVELTRNGLRTVALGWKHEDWFAALKSGLLPAQDEEIDRLENEALARGWKGRAWREPLRIWEAAQTAQPATRAAQLEEELEALRRRLLLPFEQLADALCADQKRTTGPELATAISQFWNRLEAEERLRQWAVEPTTAGEGASKEVHATVWEQMQTWLGNLRLAFPTEGLGLRDWLPIIEAGLSSVTVGVIPPALDQVVIGAVDRSRNPEVKLVLVLGLNETVFPAQPNTAVLLSETDRAELERQHILLHTGGRHHMGRERFYAYLACTRATQRLVLTCARHDANGAPLNPSPFLSQIQRLIGGLAIETIPEATDWREGEHACELVAPLLSAVRAESQVENLNSKIQNLQFLKSVLEGVGRLRSPSFDERLAPDMAARLYGPMLRTSVSRMEQFAACPFKFLVNSGLRAELRKRFELDSKEQGSFQHEVLALFHERLRRDNKRWRDVTSDQARELVADIAGELMGRYREGLLGATEQSRFMARVMIASLQDFVATLVGWMRAQYRFEPARVELPFGAEGVGRAWEIELGQGHRLALNGRIDRVDLCPSPVPGQALCVVVDYKSSLRKLDPVLMANGLQLQLPAYLSVLRHWPEPADTFGVEKLLPAGVFFVSLRGQYDWADNRTEALAQPEQSRMSAFRHYGRYNASALRQLDSSGAIEGAQFNYRRNKNGEVSANSREALSPRDFKDLLDLVETNLKEMGQKIFSGAAEVAPYRKGKAIACAQCDYRAICRLDPWTHRFRVLR